jgi:electron transfer flavoprotein beta subunit
MGDLHIVVCVKVVPKPEEIRVDPETRMLNREGVRTEINPPDMNALEMALVLKGQYGARVDILSMGPPSFESNLRAALAMGCDHIYLLSDRAFSGADTLATTYTLAKGIQKISGVDIVFLGEESSDGATGQVPAGLAEWLNIPQLTLVTDINVDLNGRVVQGKREIKGGYEILEVPLPCALSVKTAANEPRFMDFSKKAWAFDVGRVTVWRASDLSVEKEYIGLSGSPTVVSDLAEASVRERMNIFLRGDSEEIAQQLANIIQSVI